MRSLTLVWCLLSALALLGSCGKGLGTLAGAALGGGPDVAANVQAGKTNAQVIGPATFSEQKMIRPQARTIEQSAGKTGVRAEAVQSVTMNSGAPWSLVVGLMGLCLVFLCISPPQQILARWWQGFGATCAGGGPCR
ncbi:MAG: hypothetical protein COB16_06650 [Rhodobacteraceae bacterium]|nr:MAG: hypothetical protein COB16_06650 [Paracoccaceae bacterium]